MSGIERLDNAEKSLKAGDYDGLKKSVANLSDPTDTKIFMTLMADRVKDQAGLPNVSIIDDNKDGVPDKIKVDKLTLENKGSGVSAKSDSFLDGLKGKVGGAIDSVKEKASQVLESVNFVTPLENAGTDKSLWNQRQQRLERQAGLGGPEDTKK